MQSSFRRDDCRAVSFSCRLVRVCLGAPAACFPRTQDKSIFLVFRVIQQPRALGWISGMLRGIPDIILSDLNRLQKVDEIYGLGIGIVMSGFSPCIA